VTIPFNSTNNLAPTPYFRSDLVTLSVNMQLNCSTLLTTRWDMLTLARRGLVLEILLNSGGIPVIATEVQTKSLHVTEKYVTSTKSVRASIPITGIRTEFKSIFTVKFILSGGV